MTTPREKLKQYVASLPGPAAPLGTPCPRRLELSNYDARWLLEHIELLELGVAGHVAPAPFTVEKPRLLRLVGPTSVDEPPDEPGGAA